MINKTNLETMLKSIGYVAGKRKNVLECITRLMDKGYRPEHIELEKEWTLGHEKREDLLIFL